MAILSFRRELPWGEPANFVAKIRAGVKIHTFRFGDAWYPGRLIDFYDQNPRNGGQAFDLGDFDKALDWKTIERSGGRKLNLPVCSAVESWEMAFAFRLDHDDNETLEVGSWEFVIGDLAVDENVLEVVAAADGFDSTDAFVRYFAGESKRKGTDTISGQIIHWTDKVYDLETAKTIEHDYFKPRR